MTITTETDKSSSRDFGRILPGLLISAAALGITLYFVDLKQLGEVLRMADYRFVAAGLVSSLIWLFVRGFFWRTLLQNKAKYKDVFFTLSEGYLLNNLLPLRLGEVGRAYLLGRKAGLDFWHVLSTIVIERALDVVFGASILLVSLMFMVSGGWALQVGFLMGGLMVAGLVFLFIMARNHDRAIAIFDRIAARIPIVQRLGGKIIRSFLEGISILNSPLLFIKAIGWISLNWVLGLVQFYLYMRAFFPEGVEFLWVSFSLGIAAMGVAAPSSPGSIGVYEGVLVFALSLFGQNESNAFAFAVIAHLSGYLINGILGAYALAREGETLSGLYASARAMLARMKS
jgi:uncharacterized protein (TIRG00374 family)